MTERLSLLRSLSLEEIETNLVTAAWDDLSYGQALVLETDSTDFLHPACQDGWEAIRQCLSERAVINPMLIRQRMLRDGKTTASYDTLFAHYKAEAGSVIVPSDYHAFLAEVVSESTRRKFGRALDELRAQLAAGMPLGRLQDMASSRLTSVFAKGQAEAVHEREIMKDWLEELEEEDRAREAGEEKKQNYLPTGFGILDDAIDGGGEGELIVLGARPAMGKSTLALAIARNWAKTTHVYLWSGEMKRRELRGRIGAQIFGIPPKSVTTSHAREIQEHCRDLWIDDRPCRTVDELVNRIRRHNLRKGGIGAIVVDYLQLLAEANKEDVSKVSRGLKLLAMELGVPILALSQLSRNCENRDNKRPMLQDLRESGAIEQDANKVLFMYVPHKYEKGADPADCEILIRKNRSGAGNVDLMFKFYASIYTFQADPGRGKADPRPKFPHQEVSMRDIECSPFPGDYDIPDKLF